MNAAAAVGIRIDLNAAAQGLSTQVWACLRRLGRGLVAPHMRSAPVPSPLCTWSDCVFVFKPALGGLSCPPAPHPNPSMAPRYSQEKDEPPPTPRGLQNPADVPVPPAPAHGALVAVSVSLLLLRTDSMPTAGSISPPKRRRRLSVCVCCGKGGCRVTPAEGRR